MFLVIETLKSLHSSVFVIELLRVLI